MYMCLLTPCAEQVNFRFQEPIHTAADGDATENDQDDPNQSDQDAVGWWDAKDPDVDSDSDNHRSEGDAAARAHQDGCSDVQASAQRRDYEGAGGFGYVRARGDVKMNPDNGWRLRLDSHLSELLW